MKNIAQKCSDNLVSALKTMPEFATGGPWSLIDEDDLFTKNAIKKFPCAGVVYEGMRSGESKEGAGKSSEIACSVYLLYQTGTIGKVDYKVKAVAMLDAIRAKLMDTVSPTGHKWVFKFESPAEDMHGALVYYQRWSAKVIL